MAARGISTPALAIAGAGGFVLWAALQGVSLGSGLRSIIGGHAPAVPVIPADPAAASVTYGGTGEAAAAGNPNSAIAAAASAYIGQGVYRWAGAKPTGWDCSGFVNWVLSHDLGVPIPGYPHGGFTGSAHGPVTGQWAVWSGATTIGRSELAAGDLCVWPGAHMGIAVSNAQFVNCPGPNGRRNPIIENVDASHHGLVPLLCRRLKGI